MRPSSHAVTPYYADRETGSSVNVSSSRMIGKVEVRTAVILAAVNARALTEQFSTPPVSHENTWRLTSPSTINSGRVAMVGQNTIVDWVADWGRVAIDTVTSIGDLTLFAWRSLRWMFTRLPRRETLLPNFYQVGVLSLPVVALTGTFIGMVLAMQSFFQFSRIGLETRLGAVINMSLVRELGPVLAATMLAGRVGSAMAAELGTMRVTEQIDAMESMGANPHPLFGCAAYSCMPHPDSNVDNHGRLHGRNGRLLLERASFRHRQASLLV